MVSKSAVWRFFHFYNEYYYYYERIRKIHTVKKQA